MKNPCLIRNLRHNFNYLLQNMKRIFLSLSLVCSSMGLWAQAAPENWHHLEVSKGVHGIDTDGAYELLKGKTSQTVIVAVIDDGVDVNHEDLKSVMWTNEKEVAGNGKDDDNNGYIDDIHGWNFIGGASEDVDQDNQELMRLYRTYKAKYAAQKPKTAEEKAEFSQMGKMKKSIDKKRKEYQSQFDMLNAIEKIMKGASNGASIVSVGQLKPYVRSFVATTPSEKKAKTLLTLSTAKADESRSIDIDKNIGGGKKQFSDVLDYQLNESFDPRSKVGDDYANINERIYGNNHVISHNGDHGTHVSGIIAADRTNGVGMQGIADNVKIMALRVVPNGDERDKDIANAIRYAADNGAKVINMSFGKAYSWDKKAVDAAVRYAATKDVLIVHAAGNSSQNNDRSNNFPHDRFEDNGQDAVNWIEVGASSWKNGKDVTATFSNYGKTRVDVFAPGVDIYSTTKGSNYEAYSGTSMASPVTAGVAALVRSYYPKLTAVQVKKVIEESVIPYTEEVKIPGSKKTSYLSELSKTGGIVNAKNAVQKAAKMK